MTRAYLQEPLAALLDYAAINLLCCRGKRRRLPDGPDRLERYLAAADNIPAEAFFPDPEHIPDLSFERMRRRSRHRNDRVYDFEYPSPLPSAYPENNRVPCRLYRAADNNLQAPTVIYAPPWKAWSHSIYRGYCTAAAEWGYNAVFLVTPYHMERTPAGYFSGDLALTTDVLHTISAFRQAVADLRALIRALTKAGCPRVALVGTSLGGTYAALTACVEPSLDAAALNTPACELLKQLTLTAVGRHLDPGRRMNKYLRALIPALKPITPRYHRPAIDPDNIFISLAEYDRIVLNRATLRLARAWRVERVVKFPQGHISINYFSPALRAELKKFLEDRIGKGGPRHG